MQVRGEPTREFWKHAIEKLRTISDFDTDEAPSFTIKRQRVYVSMREFYKSSEILGEFEAHVDFDNIFHILSEHAARTIYENRVAKGEINDESLKPHYVMQRIRRYTRPPKPDECGFMEELILKGGRFASE